MISRWTVFLLGLVLLDVGIEGARPAPAAFGHFVIAPLGALLMLAALRACWRRGIMY